MKKGIIIMNKKSRKLIALIIVLIMASGLIAACGGGGGDSETSGSPSANQSTQPTTTGGTSPDFEQQQTGTAEAPEEGANLADHMDILFDISGLTVVNPNASGATGASSIIYDLVHDKLLEIRGPGIYVPGLATHWETDDFQTIRFYLREGVTFHNGDPFSAEDVKFTIEIALASPAGTAWTRLRFIEEVNVIDPYTVDIVYNTPNADYEFEISHWGSGILNQRAYNEAPDDFVHWGMVGTGPYRMIEFSSANVIRLERNEDYWGEEPPTRSLAFWSVAEQATRYVMLQTGQVQMVQGLNSEDLDELLGNPDFNVIQDLLHMPTYLGFNNQGDAIMMDTNFRLAVAHAINQDDLATVVGGNWTRGWPSGNLWGLRTPFYREDLPRRAQDLTLAAQYLDASVYNGEPIELVAVGDAGQRAAELVQIQLAEIGIDISIEMMDVPSYVEAFAYNPSSTRQMSIFSIGVSPTALGTLRALMYSGSNTNRLNINSELLDRNTDLLATEQNPDRQRELVYEIQQHLYDTLAGIPIYHGVSGLPTVLGVGGFHHWGDNFRYSYRGIYWDLNQTPERFLP